ncbi:tail fiber protein, partial [Salmonella enterica]|nr:tail fiber protein [Salmonella enterica]EEF8371737.1 tail fiber protein [Salmonella enterica]EEI4535229.1 tail fiber protein [Salmonella enterica]EJP3912996.1 tail fiber protein [Salmonella enterica]HAF5759952.1 tail fiber protein [Salmonella enterica]
MKPLMKPIDTPDRVFHDGDPSIGELGTICSAEWLNDTQVSIRDIQAECIAILRANGFEPDETKRDQLWEAIQAAIKSKVPAATLTTAGISLLSSSVTSDSETIAATLKAVKIAMDNGNARMAKDRNGSDIPNKALFRQNLELGNSATLNTGTTAGTVAAGDDARILATKKAIDDTQTGLAEQPVMWISTADDLSSLPSGARRFASNKAPATILPVNDYVFLEVIAKRDCVDGCTIQITDSIGNTWIGSRWDATNGSSFIWLPLMSCPPGVPLPWPSDAIPAGYALMQGQSFDK